MTALLARWTEKLAGGPQAGTSDSPPLARVMGVGRQQKTNINALVSTLKNCLFHIKFILQILNLRTSQHIVSLRDKPEHETKKFWKVNPLIEATRQKCLSLVREEYLSIDEQMIPFTGCAPAKQFVKGKPSPEGLKNLVCCGKSGTAYYFIIYQSKGTGIDKKYKALGLGGSVVKTLLESVDENVNHEVCFDNYFTSVDLVKDLKDNGIFAVGVI